MKQNEQHPPNAMILDIDAAIRKRSGRGAVDVELSSHESYCIDNNDLLGYEYLNHTADIQLHSWGSNLCEALEKLAIAMFGYMVSLDTVEIDEEFSMAAAENIVAEGHDMQSMIFNFLDEWLFVFHSTYFIAKGLKISNIDRKNFVITSSAQGEKMDVSKHSQGTEVKAITYSNMQIEEDATRCDVWVIVDI